MSIGHKWLYLIRLQIGATAATYGLAINVLLVMRALLGEQAEVVALFNIIAPWLTLGTVAGLIVSLVAPYRRYWLMWSLPGAVAFVVWQGMLFVPGRPWGPPRTADPFTVVTFNIDGYTAETLAAIEALDADLLGLEELNPKVGIAGVEALYPYWSRYPGVAVFSRYPIVEEQVLEFTNLMGKPQTVAVRVTVDLDGHRVSVYAAYPERPTISIRPLVYDDRQHKRGVRVLLDAIQADPNPVILLCDCNFSPTSQNYAATARLLKDSWRAAGFGLGFTVPISEQDAPFPVIRSDYIWHSAELATRKVKVVTHHGDSDHYPVRAELGWVVGN